jgi:hypothetical protein
MGSLDPDPNSQSGSVSMRAKMAHKNRKKIKKILSAECSLLRTEGFSPAAWTSFIVT